APTSAYCPSWRPARTVSTRPPTRSRASSTTTSWPARRTSRAATRPDRPAPTTISRMRPPRRIPGSQRGAHLGGRALAAPDRALHVRLRRVVAGEEDSVSRLREQGEVLHQAAHVLGVAVLPAVHVHPQDAAGVLRVGADERSHRAAGDAVVRVVPHHPRGRV